MKTVKGRPITGGRTEMRPRNPSTRLNTTTQAEQQIRTPPAPFKTSAGIANAPTGSRNMAEEGIPYGNTSAPGKHPTRSPGSGIPSIEQLRAAIGQRKPTNFTNREVHVNAPDAGLHAPSKARPAKKGGKMQRGFKTNGDIFNKGVADYKRYGG